jgi:hypothetical protein
MIRAAALALGGALLACLPAASAQTAASESTFVIETDRRVELLGIVQYLAGSRDPRVPLPVQYGKEIERRFGRLRGHPAVKLYRELAAEHQEFGVDMLFLTDPPELRTGKNGPPPFGGGSPDFERFLVALRRFAAEGDFAGFYAGQRDAYREFEASARREAGRRNFPRLVEEYAGRGLESRCHFILALSYAPTRGISYVIPYPDPEHGTGVKGPYDVYVLLPPEAGGAAPSFFGAYRGAALDELIYVFIERTYFPYVKDRADEEATLLAALGGACRDRHCLKDLLVRAIGLRLRAAACPEGGCDAHRHRKTDGAIELFAGRLSEYEGARDRYPSLDLFYPRLLAPPPAAPAAAP